MQDERKSADGKIPGFGQLHPRTQGVTTLGTIYSSSLFPGRAPEGMFLMLNYIGGATNRGILEQPDEDIVAQARTALDDAGLDGIRLGGNYVSGVALGKCIEYGYTFAEEISGSVKANV